jgi:hypothetical protein
MGRKVKDFDAQTFEGLCGIHCTEREICSVLRTSEKTIGHWCKRYYGKPFAEVYKDFVNIGNVSLRRNQMKMAQYNPTMAIWLGKNYLGQTDSPEKEKKENELLTALVDLYKISNS